jgi:hypothetical protein
MNDVPTDQAHSVDGPQQYEIRVKGHLAARWADRFDGMTVTPHSDGTTTIRGPVTDQSQLHGLLHTISNVGLSLVSVTPTAPGEPTTIRTTHSPSQQMTHPRRSTP